MDPTKREEPAAPDTALESEVDHELVALDVALDPVWRLLGRRVASGSAAFFALVVLMREGTLLRAVLVGAATLVTIALVWRGGLALLERALSRDAAPERADEGAAS